MVWHWRRNTVKAYIGQQKGYGKAEALVYSKHPTRFNLFCQAKWLGRIYGDLSASLLLSRRPVIYSGVFGRGLFQNSRGAIQPARSRQGAHQPFDRGRETGLMAQGRLKPADSLFLISGFAISPCQFEGEFWSGRCVIFDGAL